MRIILLTIFAAVLIGCGNSEPVYYEPPNTCPGYGHCNVCHY